MICYLEYLAVEWILRRYRNRCREGKVFFSFSFFNHIKLLKFL